MTKEKIYDFCDDNGALPDSDSSNDFFIDGWDAYRRWLDDVRETIVDTGQAD